MYTKMKEQFDLKTTPYFSRAVRIGDFTKKKLKGAARAWQDLIWGLAARSPREAGLWQASQAHLTGLLFWISSQINTYSSEEPMYDERVRHSVCTPFHLFGPTTLICHKSNKIFSLDRSWGWTSRTILKHKCCFAQFFKLPYNWLHLCNQFSPSQLKSHTLMLSVVWQFYYKQAWKWKASVPGT